MNVRDTSQRAFDELTGTGAKATLRAGVFAAICEIGPVHNLRLLEYLQQKEKLKRRADRIDWTRSNCWPRVTYLVSHGAVKDLGSFSGSWYDQKKTLHFWAVSGQSNIPAGWEKVTKKKAAAPTITAGVPDGAKQKTMF